MFKCTQCEMRFFSEIDCCNHAEAEHPDAGIEACTQVFYRCTICEQSFGHPRDCRNHGLREHGLQEIECVEFEVARAGIK